MMLYNEFLLFFNHFIIFYQNSPRKNSKGTSSLVNSVLPGTTPPRQPLKPSLSNPGQSTTPVITAVETKPSES